jgi:protein-disulfide isomerase
MSKHTHAARIRQDLLSGEQSGVEGTPTFFINGVRYDESWDLETLPGAIKNTM